MRTRFSAAIFCTLLGGCAFFPDFEHTPAARLPVAEVVNQIRCDMYEFLKDHRAGRAAFSLDEESYATVELTLSTTGAGDVKFARIDTVRLGAQNWLAKEPFPNLGLKQQSEVTAKVQVNISQNPDDLRVLCERGYEYGYAEVLSNKPYADRVLINNMRVASWLKRTFENSDRIVPSGAYCNERSGKGPEGARQTACSVGLDTATLITKFQLVGDVSGGLLSLERLIPVVATPTLGLELDYSHQIKIIFQGNNVVDRKSPVVIRDAVTRSPPGGPQHRRLEKSLCDFETDKQKRDECFERERKKQRTPQVRPQGPRPVDSAGVERQLRSIRDALILSAPSR